MTDHSPTNMFSMVLFPVKFSPSQVFSWQNSRKSNLPRDYFGFGLVFFPSSPQLLSLYICTLGTAMLRAAPSYCYIIELDTSPGIWRMAADLMCELDFFFYLFSLGKGSLQAW